MYVSIAVDPGSEERAKELAELLIQYGFDKVQRGLWESSVVSAETLGRIKRDIDRSSDTFDRIRIFQFPVDGTLVMSTLKEKRWRRLVAKGQETRAPEPVKAAVQKPAAPLRQAHPPQGKPVRKARHGRRATDQ